MEQKCIFCAIVAKQIQALVVYEDDEFFAFLDIRPRNPGHTLVIPKKHYRWAYDLDDENFGKYWKVARRIAHAQIKALGANSVSFVTLGLEVPHAHIQIIPRFENDGHGGVIDWSIVKEVSEEEMKQIAQKIKENIEPEKKIEKVEEKPKVEKKERTAEETFWIRRSMEMT